jgi:hypothetical protein
MNVHRERLQDAQRGILPCTALWVTNDAGMTTQIGGSMDLINLVLALALAQFIYFGVMVGRARGKYGVAAPATTGNEMFERYFRVQMNTLELLVAFVPGIYAFSQYYSQNTAALFGAVYLIGRGIFFVSYVKDPKSRSLGFGLSMMPILVFIIGTLYGAASAYWRAHGG